MNKNKIDNEERILAYKAGNLITNKEIKNVAGGSNSGTNQWTTKQTVDTMGNVDVGGDYRWD